MRFLLALLSLSLAGPAAAQSSRAAAWLLEREIAEACGGGGGSIDPAGLIERDLTGDGRADLVIAHEWVRCADGRRSGFCGMQVCTVKVFVREGDLLRPAGELLGGGVAVAPGPMLTGHAHGGARWTLRWTGRGFEHR